MATNQIKWADICRGKLVAKNAEPVMSSVASPGSAASTCSDSSDRLYDAVSWAPNSLQLLKGTEERTLLRKTEMKTLRGHDGVTDSIKRFNTNENQSNFKCMDSLSQSLNRTSICSLDNQCEVMEKFNKRSSNFSLLEKKNAVNFNEQPVVPERDTSRKMSAYVCPMKRNNNSNQGWRQSNQQNDWRPVCSKSGNGLSSRTRVQDSGAPCFDKRDFLYAGLSNQHRHDLQLDEVAYYSVTDMKTAAQISQYILSLNNISNDSVITDATACVGGNTASFCQYFAQVYAVEFDETRYKMLTHNLQSVFNYRNVICICKSYLDVMLNIQQDVVFIDPPWGGPEYKHLKEVDLYLGDIELAELCESIKAQTKYVVLKVPQNFAVERFQSRVSGGVTVKVNFRKMLLIVVEY